MLQQCGNMEGVRIKGLICVPMVKILGGLPEGCLVYIVHLAVWESDSYKHMLVFSMTLWIWNDLLLTFVYMGVGSSQL